MAPIQVCQEAKGPSRSLSQALGNLWWSRRESNPRPLECDSSALPTELRPHTEAASGLGRAPQGPPEAARNMVCPPWPVKRRRGDVERSRRTVLSDADATDSLCAATADPPGKHGSWMDHS